MSKMEYEKLAKKNKLPSYEDLNNEFEISAIEKTDFLLRSILRKAKERYEYLLLIMEDILQPNESSVSGMHECRFFNDEQRTELFNLYVRSMRLYREITSAEVSLEEKDVNFAIQESHKHHKQIREEIKPFIKILKGAWGESITEKEVLG